MTREEAEVVVALYLEKYPECNEVIDRGRIIYTVPTPEFANDQKPNVFYGPNSKFALIEKSLYFHNGDYICFREALRKCRKRPILTQKVPRKKKVFNKGRPDFSTAEQNLIERFF